MRICRGLLFLASAGLFFAPAAPSHAAETEIAIEWCGRLPVVILQVDKVDRRFLLDTAATSFLNSNSFSGRHSREVLIRSWNGTTALNGSDISIDELSLGSHVIQNVKLPAIDLSGISQGCGGQLDGILGVDLLEQLGVTIDLERRVARLGVASDPREPSLITAVEKTLESCSAAFNNADLEKLAACFDPEFVLSSPGGELHGRDQAVNYFRQYFGVRPRPRLAMTMNSPRGVGELVWGGYDYTIETPSSRTSGQGMMLCRKSGKGWYILSMSPFATREIPVR